LFNFFNRSNFYFIILNLETVILDFYAKFRNNSTTNLFKKLNFTVGHCVRKNFLHNFGAGAAGRRRSGGQLHFRIPAGQVNVFIN